MKIALSTRVARPIPTLAACSMAALLGACGGTDAGNGAQAGTTTAATILSANAYDLWVATHGSDANPGSHDAPVRTISRAAALATPGATIHVAPGYYAGNVVTNTSGTAAAPIRILSDGKWAAVIVGSGSEAMWTNNGDHVEINGFDISGPGRLGIVNYASNTLIANNHIHDLTISGGCNGSGGAGVVNADYAASNGNIVGNVVHDIGTPGACNGVQGIYSTNRGGQISNNVVYRAAAFGIHLWHGASDVTIVNNTVFANGSAGMGGGIVIGNGELPGNQQLTNTRVLNNIVYDNPRGGIQEYCYAGENCIGAGNIVSNNLVYGSAAPVVMLVGSATGTIEADPRFVRYDPAGNGDYRLQSDSPAIDRGLGAAAPLNDIMGVARTQRGAIDLGAYESY